MDKSLRTEKEIIKMRESALSDWRKDLQEEHPYVELMPSPQPKDMRELKKEMKAKERMEMGEALETGDEYHKRMKEKNKAPINPFPMKQKPFDPDARKKQRAAQLKAAAKNAPKDTRTDAEKMADATGPRDAFGRPAKSGFRGD